MQIVHSIWFDNTASEALRFYTSLFPNSRIVTENQMATEAELSGVRFLGINGGPMFKPNASISFMIICETREEIDRLWAALGTDGRVYMELSTYPWSEYYGWVGDRYGVTWQLYLGQLSEVNNQKIVPTAMFTREVNGRCAEALDFYASVFPDFQLQGAMKYPEGEMEGLIMHAQFVAKGNTFMAMDGGDGHDFQFNEGISFLIPCRDQAEIDHYWNAFTKDGKPSMCGWCQDPFGVFWQVAPENIDQLMLNPESRDKILQMKKIDLSLL